MRTILFILSFLFITSSIGAETYTVEGVIDGDTIKLTDCQTVRLIGIQITDDEKKRQEGKLFLVSILGTTDDEEVVVNLEYDVEKRDKDGSLLAYIYKDAGVSSHVEFQGINGYEYSAKGGRWYVFINATIIKSGYAQPQSSPPNVKHEELFKELYKDAIENQRGLWKVTCESKADCQFLECSNYDNPIKTGYQHDCVNGQCKCMCYGCK